MSDERKANRVDARGVARVSARAVTGVIALAVAAVAIGGATLLPLPSFSVASPSSTVVPVPTSQQRVCPGPLLELAADSSAATALSAFGRPSTESGSGADDASPSITSLSSADNSTDNRFGGPLVVSVPVRHGAVAPPEVAASQVQSAALEDFAGLAASSCEEASTDSWLVGGSNALGQTSLVLLSNPSAVQATVDLTIYGESGPVAASGSSGIVVAPGTQRVVPLAGLAPAVTAPVIHVQTAGGQILASIQQSYVNGLDPEGVELVGPTNEPATHQVIAGMTIRTLTALEAGPTSERYAENLPALRVLVPGTKPATVRVGATGETGTEAGNSASTTVQPGVVTEIPLAGLADGDFTVTVDSNQPVVVASRTTTTSSVGTDFAWFVASQRLSRTDLVAVAGGPEPTLHLANEGPSNATISLTSEAGVTKNVLVPSQGGAGIPIPAAGMYTLNGAADIVASVSYTGNGAMSSFAINPPGPLAAPIVVYPK